MTWNVNRNPNPIPHSFTNKTVVVQLRSKSTTGSSFLLEYIRYFCRRVWSITPKKFPFRVSVWVNNCLYPFMLNISLISLVQMPVHRRYTGNTVRLEGYGYGSYWLTYAHCSDCKCNVTQNASGGQYTLLKARQSRGHWELHLLHLLSTLCPTLTLIVTLT